jgi:hypothetical protein
MNRPLLTAWMILLGRMVGACSDPRPRREAVHLALALLCTEGPKTITRALRWLGHTQQDWTGDYRLFSHVAWQPSGFFAPVLAEAVAQRGQTPGPFYAAQDDTLIRKTGKHIPGTAYARDPLGPAFQVNLVLGQRFLQTGLCLQPGGPEHPWRAIPVGFRHVPPLKTPPRATEEQKAAVKEARKKHNLCTAAAQELELLRQQLDRLPAGPERWLIMAVDGGYTNRRYLRHLPERTDAVGRLRKDARLRAYLPPDQRTGARKYGPPLPTPEAYLKDDSIPWQELGVFVAGQWRTLKYKLIEELCWPGGTLDRPLRLIVIKAAGYRLRKGSRLLYRQPAFLITTSLTAPVEDLIKAYLARWEMEVTFRDEKSIVGVGQAQVRHPQSVARAPAFLVAAYAALLLASIQVFGDRRTEAFRPLPAWRRDRPLRPSTRDLIERLRQEAEADRTQSLPRERR